MARFFLQVAIVLVLLATGCGRAKRLADIEAKERNSVRFRQAHAAEQAGNLDDAVTLLNRVLIEQPKDYSAHFQLATLLHDHVQDYIGAIYHYRRYIELRNDSEKTQLAKDRLRVAEQMLAPQILKKVGDSVEGISQVRLIKEVEKLNGEIAALTGEKAAMKEQMDAQSAKMKEVESDNARLRKILDKMREAPAPAATASVVKREMPAPAAESRKTIPKREKPVASSKKPLPKRESVPNPDTRLTSEELRRLRAEAAQLSSATARNRSDGGAKTVVEPPKETSPALAEEDDGSKSDEEFLSRFIKRTTRIKDTEGGGKSQPERRRTYVVKPGDTLVQLSVKFYGSKTQWKKIRDANRATIDPDGRIRPGQIIVVP